MLRTIEVCVDSLHGAELATAAGCDRIELCAALETSGVTPTPQFINAVRRLIRVPLIVLVRCRTGDFVYSQAERELMFDEVRMAIDSGADGVAVGGLDTERQLDAKLLEPMRSLVGERQLVMHRAFDVVPDLSHAVSRLVEWSFDRILTSGGATSASVGVEQLRVLQSQFGTSVEILPAGGVHRDNYRDIVSRSGCTQIHGSFRTADSGVLPDSFSIKQIAAQR